MSGDASTRLYERLRFPDGRTAVLMDQPPAAETEPAPPDASEAERRAKGYNALARLAGGRVDAFVAVAAYLRGRGLSAPEILAFDVDAGFALLEDLGEALFARLIEAGTDPQGLYEAATDVQVHLHDAPPATVIEADGVRWAVPVYDALALETYTELFLDWWPSYAGLAPLPAEARRDYAALCAPIRRRAEDGASVFAHRDFHAENLLWLPGRPGLKRVGLLDFQDAVTAHPAWDLAHLLQDARRDVEPALEAAMLDRYLTARPAVDRTKFLADYRALAALNAARILGPIFARQVVQFGRARYAAFMPRTWRYLERDLDHPDLDDLRAWFDRWIPKASRP
jgi:aminoglycoside/choline kinase family phosphotransferase